MGVGLVVEYEMEEIYVSGYGLGGEHVVGHQRGSILFSLGVDGVDHGGEHLVLWVLEWGRGG